MKPEDSDDLRLLWAAAEASLLPLRVHQANVAAVKRLEARLSKLAGLEGKDAKPETAAA